jgi:hypothetical protein
VLKVVAWLEREYCGGQHKATYKICLSVTSDFYRLHYFLSASATSPRYRCSASMSASDDFNLYLLDVYTECRDMSASVVLFVGT